MIQTITTDEFAKRLGVQPTTVRRSHSLNGHYLGIKPIKLPNRLLMWELDTVEKIFKKSNQAGR